MPKFLINQLFSQSGHNRFNHGWLQKTSVFPIVNGHFIASRGRLKLAGDGHNNDIGPMLMIVRRANHDGRSFFQCRLICKREGNEDNVAKLKAGRSRHRAGCPKESEKMARLDDLLPRRGLVQIPDAEENRQNLPPQQLVREVGFAVFS